MFADNEISAICHRFIFSVGNMFLLKLMFMLMRKMRVIGQAKSVLLYNAYNIKLLLAINSYILVLNFEIGTKKFC